MQGCVPWHGLTMPVMVVFASVTAGGGGPALADDTTPAGMVAYFATQSECPTGWTAATYLQGRLALAITDTETWTLGTQVGTALANQTAPSHAHSFAVTLSLAEDHLKYGDCGGDTTGGAKKGSYTVNGPTLSSDTGLPLFQILACERQDSGQASPDGYGSAALALFNRDSCPGDWIPATDSKGNQINGYFIMPFEAPPNGTVGTPVGTPYGNGEKRTHTHTLTSSIDLLPRQYESFLGSCSSLTSDGTHSFSGTTDGAFNNVPYAQLLLCEREPNLLGTNPPTGVPTNVVTSFGSQSCPYGWKPSATGSGRFFVGLPDGGTEDQAFGGGNPLAKPGDRPQHSHGLKGSVSISEQKVALASGTDSPIFGHDGTYDYGGSTDAGNFGLPYLTAANCQPCVENDSNPVCQQQAKPQ